jgi:hypothetical protein
MSGTDGRRVVWLAGYLAVFALVAALAPGGAAEARRQPPSCAKKAGKTLRASREVRVFQKGRQVYGCLRRGRRVMRLGGWSLPYGSDEIRNITLRGRFGAFSLRRSGLRVRVVDLRRRRVVHDAKGFFGSIPFGFLTDIKLTRGGAVGWVARADPIDVLLNPYAMPTDFLPSFEVGKADRDGPTLLDSGHFIVGGSLRLSGSTLSWVNGHIRHARALH